MLVVIGADSPSVMRQEAIHAFRGFGRTKAPPFSRSLPSLSSDPAASRVEMPTRAQVEVRVGGLSVPRASSEYAGVFLANEILGGRTLLNPALSAGPESGRASPTTRRARSIACGMEGAGWPRRSTRTRTRRAHRGPRGEGGSANG